MAQGSRSMALVSADRAQIRKRLEPRIYIPDSSALPQPYPRFAIPDSAGLDYRSCAFPIANVGRSSTGRSTSVSLSIPDTIG